MAGLTIYQANSILASVFGSGNPATLYIALCESSPNSGSNGLSIAEPTPTQWANYARVAVANNSTNWPVPALGQVANGTPITFVASSGPAGSFTFPYVAVLDALTGGNLQTYGPLVTPVTVSTGVAPSFGVGALTFAVI